MSCGGLEPVGFAIVNFCKHGVMIGAIKIKNIAVKCSIGGAFIYNFYCDE